MKVLEFYSGIGGWSEALEAALRRLGRQGEDVQVGGLAGRMMRLMERERNFLFLYSCRANGSSGTILCKLRHPSLPPPSFPCSGGCLVRDQFGGQ
jgi:hypothetical protein